MTSLWVLRPLIRALTILPSHTSLQPPAHPDCDIMDSSGTSCVLIFVAIIFPPAAAAFVSGCGCDLFVNILLTLLGYLPGLIHALWLVFKRVDVQERRAAGSYRYTGSTEAAPPPQLCDPQPTAATYKPSAPPPTGYGAMYQGDAPPAGKV
ncbi:uncharacterized protein EDB91DRAFT_173980 [Suillus paluster]|uniref:uncharacterized protein n=1 Tax=Suillus paluster TaxID=48578 RepID=UPI001B8768BF|nr:uncharacterized protein EDB91DRAFT_173980 [Suillus paluster]KAG1745081.1 hypothetical protein EDB91DRAFT_173980 [Suillus paluster]